MKNSKRILLYAILIISIIFFLVYIFSSCFRNFLSESNIDPNFLVAFVSTIGLLLSIISIKKERKFNFSLNLKKSTEDKVIIVVGKLIGIMNNSEIYLITIKNIKYSIENYKKFIDGNDALFISQNFNKDTEILGAYVEIYFKNFIFEDWNLLQEKISKLASNCSMVLSNYNENINLINTIGFENFTINNIDNILQESEKLNKEIYELSEKMKDSLLNIISENDKKIRDKYIN